MSPGDIIWVLAGVVLISLGALVLLRCHTVSATAFGVFAVGLGSLYASLALDAPAAAVLAGNLVIMAGFWAMFLVFPTRLARGERRLLIIAFLLGALAGAAFHFPRIQASALVSPEALVMQILFFASYVGILAGVVLFPLRARRLRPAETAAARSLAIFSIGVALFRGFDAEVIVSAARGDVPLAAAVVPLLVFVLPPILWVLVAARDTHARLARNTVLAHTAVVVAALFLWRAEGGAALLGLGGALMLGFTVLRGQIEGLDLKVRFALSKSTVAAVFIAVFFIVSEAAQQFLGDTTGSTYLGIAAAGALVFAIAPLQRMAERLAERAVPVTAETDPLASVSSGKEEAYRRALRMMLRDQTLTRDEERDLFLLASELGLSPVRAFELREEIERAMAGKEGAGE